MLNKKELLHLMDYLCDTLSVGMSLQDALKKYIPENKKLIKDYKLLNLYISKGLSFSASLRKTKLFPEQLISVIETGEVTGSILDVCLDLKEKVYEEILFKKEIIKIMTMPVITMIAGIGAFFFMVISVIPNVAKSIMKIGKLPDISKTIFSIAIMINQNIIYILIGMSIIVAILFHLFKSTPPFWLYNLPLLGKFLKYSYASNFFYQLSILLKGGVSVVEAIKKIKNSTRTQMEKIFLTDILKNMQKGLHFDEAIQKSKYNLFPYEIQNILYVLKSTAEYIPVSNRIVISSRQKTKEYAQRLATIIEPVTIVALGILVFLLVIAVYYPIISITTV